jgi:hypothetical protein
MYTCCEYEPKKKQTAYFLQLALSFDVIKGLSCVMLKQRNLFVSKMRELEFCVI